VADNEMSILTADEMKSVLAAMRTTTIYPQIVILLSTGMRRGELMGL
jgi:integrase